MRLPSGEKLRPISGFGRVGQLLDLEVMGLGELGCSGSSGSSR